MFASLNQTNNLKLAKMNTSELPKTILSLDKKYFDAIVDFSDERNNGDGWWIYLKPPFWNPELECRIIHEQNLASCIKQLKSIVNNNLVSVNMPSVGYPNSKTTQP